MIKGYSFYSLFHLFQINLTTLFFIFTDRPRSNFHFIVFKPTLFDLLYYFLIRISFKRCLRKNYYPVIPKKKYLRKFITTVIIGYCINHVIPFGSN